MQGSNHDMKVKEIHVKLTERGSISVDEVMCRCKSRQMHEELSVSLGLWFIGLYPLTFPAVQFLVTIISFITND